LWIKSRGILNTIKRIKIIRLIVTRYISGSPLTNVEERIGIACNGFPKSIYFLKKFVDSGDPQQLRFVLTLLIVSRALVAHGKPNYDSITRPFSGNPDFDIPSEFITKFHNEILKGGLRKVSYNLSHFYVSCKAGPVGLSLASCIADIKRYTNITRSALGTIFGDHLLGYAGKDYLPSFVTIEAMIPKKLQEAFVTKSYDTHRRLSLVLDHEGKTRVIAILSYFEQVCLKVYNKQLFKLLKNLPQDRTFTQNPYLPHKEGHLFWSLDLKEATDRLPIVLQEKLILSLSGSVNFARAWRKLLSYEPFMTPEGKLISYEVGQPIGAYTSWTILALTHHIIVQYSAHEVGLYPFSGYILLGDDIVINDDRVAKKYMEVINNLGVEISPTKTHVSKTTYEFAKRFFHNGIEISGLPLAGLITQIRKPVLVFQEMRNLFDQGRGPIRFVALPVLVMDLMKRLNLFKYNFRKIQTHLEFLNSVIRFINRSNYTMDELRSFIANSTISEISLPYALKELEKIISKVFSRALGDHCGELIDIMDSMASRVEKVFEPHIEDYYPPESKCKWLIYHQAPHFHAIFNEVAKLSLCDTVDNFKYLSQNIQKVIWPDVDSMFIQRKSILIMIGLSKVTKTYCEIIKCDPTVFLEPGKSLKIVLAYEKAKAHLNLLRLCPSERAEMQLQIAQAEIISGLII
jgi:hypothetical protein